MGSCLRCLILSTSSLYFSPCGVCVTVVWLFFGGGFCCSRARFNLCFVPFFFLFFFIPCFRLLFLKVTEDEIANAAGISDTHDGVNFMRAACVIAVEKVGEGGGGGAGGGLHA